MDRRDILGWFAGISIMSALLPSVAAAFFAAVFGFIFSAFINADLIFIKLFISNIGIMLPISEDVGNIKQGIIFLVCFALIGFLTRYTRMFSYAFFAMFPAAVAGFVGMTITIMITVDEDKANIGGVVAGAIVVVGVMIFALFKGPAFIELENQLHEFLISLVPTFIMGYIVLITPINLVAMNMTEEENNRFVIKNGLWMLLADVAIHLIILAGVLIKHYIVDGNGSNESLVA